MIGDQVLADARDARTRAGGTRSRSRSSLHVILYMLAVGPPRSVMTPRKSSMRDSARTSRSTLSALRLWMTRPSCSVMEQNVQPPKQPRIVTIECFTVSNAGIALARTRVRRARERQVVEPVHRPLRRAAARAG